MIVKMKFKNSKTVQIRLRLPDFYFKSEKIEFRKGVFENVLLSREIFISIESKGEILGISGCFVFKAVFAAI